jgi:hypothetical protein
MVQYGSPVVPDPTAGQVSSSTYRGATALSVPASVTISPMINVNPNKQNPKVVKMAFFAE